MSKYRDFKSTWGCVSARENVSLREEHGTNRENQGVGQVTSISLVFFYLGAKKKTRGRRKILAKFKHATEAIRCTGYMYINYSTA